MELWKGKLPAGNPANLLKNRELRDVSMKGRPVASTRKNGFGRGRDTGHPGQRQGRSLDT